VGGAYFAGFVLCDFVLCMLLTGLASDHGFHSQSLPFQRSSRFLKR